MEIKRGTQTKANIQLSEYLTEEYEKTNRRKYLSIPTQALERIAKVAAKVVEFIETGLKGKSASLVLT
ncbi:MAG: hypothetical protein JEY71_18255 [Sphaerochaeta sp.]|nr:hypothetical protein [Sphaerochaeta sp.]